MKKRFIIIPLAVVASLSLVVAVPFIVLAARSNGINVDYQYLKDDTTYSFKEEVSGVELVTQEISCGYATIEMMSSYYGNKVSEEELSDKNGGGISTSSSDGFLNELNQSVPSHAFIKHSYLRNDDLLKEIHTSLAKNHPVAIEWAALYENEWTLHFSLVTAIDLSHDNVTIYNPYGYIENINVDDFINRTTFNAYDNIPLFLNFGFAFGAFEKNTIFYTME